MLTQKTIDSAKPKEKVYRLYDGGRSGLCLEIAPTGGKRWRLRYRFSGKANMISLGLYPAVTLKDARGRALEARKLLSQGVDPVREKHEGKAKSGHVFEVVAREWWEKFMEPNGGRYPAEVWRRMEREIFPFIGKMALSEITAPDVLAILRRIEARGTIETAHKIKSFISQVMRYGIACGIVYHNPARDLSGAIAPKRKTPRAAIIDPRNVGQLMRSIYGYDRGVVRCALKLAALTFVRPGELRLAEWVEVDLDGAQWRISAERMKMKRAHIVPLSVQGIEVLRELRDWTGQGKYLFPSVRTLERPMSDMTVNAALRALGYTRDKMTGHGFRAMASSLLSEQGWSVDAIERQLAHVENNQVRAAYHRADHLAERKKMMQAWADYLDTLRVSTP